MTSNPADEEYLDLLYGQLAQRSYLNMLQRTTNVSEAEKLTRFEELVAADLYRSDQFDEYAELASEMNSPRGFFKGKYIQSLKGAAIAAMGSSGEHLKTIPVGLLPSQELNAFAIPTPSGGSAIVLNHGLIWQLTQFFRSAVAFITWHSSTPYCRDSPQGAYAIALIGLADFASTGDLRKLLPHSTTLAFPSIGDYDSNSATFAYFMELFILLHEYGHIAKGHLDRNNLNQVILDSTLSVQKFNKSEIQEFEADEYAVSQLMSAGCEKRFKGSDIALIAGLVMKFFELCEFIAPQNYDPATRSHPPPAERWKRIQAQTRLDEGRDSLAHALDPAFGQIMRIHREVRSAT